MLAVELRPVWPLQAPVDEPSTPTCLSLEMHANSSALAFPPSLRSVLPCALATFGAERPSALSSRWKMAALELERDPGMGGRVAGY